MNEIPFSCGSHGHLGWFEKTDETGLIWASLFYSCSAPALCFFFLSVLASHQTVQVIQASATNAAVLKVKPLLNLGPSAAGYVRSGSHVLVA